MKVSTKTRYALRLMLQLAIDYGKKPLMLGEIARREGLSEKYLSLIVISLRARGLINSVRGSKGGYFLAKEPSKITVKDIYEATDGIVCTVDCANSKKNYVNTSLFVTREVWLKLDRAIEDSLAKINLLELVETYNKKKLSVNYDI